MPRATQSLKVEREADAARWIVRSPVVGRIAILPARGTHVEPGTVVGTITVLRREVDLVMPADARGVVIERLVSGRHPWVEYREALFRVAEGLEIEDGADGGAGVAGVAARGDGSGNPGTATEIPAGCMAVRAPTDGLFYRRPSPDAPEYVTEGSRVETGTVLGLIEVMKCFNPIVYEQGAAGGAPGIIERILVKDGAEVKSGEVLMLVRPGT